MSHPHIGLRDMTADVNAIIFNRNAIMFNRVTGDKVLCCLPNPEANQQASRSLAALRTSSAREKVAHVLRRVQEHRVHPEVHGRGEPVFSCSQGRRERLHAS